MSFINKWPALLVFVLASVFPTTAFACYPAKVTMEQRVTAAQSIYVGVVTAVIKDSNSRSLSPSVKPYSVKVAVSAVLKGKKNQTDIQPLILNCGSGSASQNEKVIVFLSDGYWYTTKFEAQKYQDLLAVVKQ
ncbi:MAG: hypothetical protein MJK04_30790 [Psychrosphaera sp.]|nr:hypothetical protein [Psychrosphaera sp.]